MRALAFVIALCLPLAAFGSAVGMSSSMVWGDAAKLSSVAINTACVADPGNDDTPDCASFELDTRGYRDVFLIIRYVRGAASAIQIHKDDSITGGTPWGVLQRGDGTSPPTVTLGDHVAADPVSGNETLSIGFKVTAPYTRFRFTSTGGNSSDVVTVYYVLIP